MKTTIDKSLIGGYEAPAIQQITILPQARVLAGSDWDRGELDDSFNNMYDL